LAIQHCLKACKENGRVAMIMPEGFFTQKIKKYQDTKKWIIENYSIQAIISLPKGIFLPYTGSKSSVIIIKKKSKTKDYFYYYQIKNDGFTLNNHRDRMEGINDWDILVSAWKEVVIEEKANSPLFTKIYYKDVEENGYNLLIRPYNFPLPKNEKNNYLLLSEVTRVFSSYRASSLKEDFINNGSYKVYQQEHVINNDFSLNDRYISEEKYQELKGHELKTNDVLMTIMGTLGKVAIFPKNAEKGIAYGSNVIIRIKEEWKERISPEYLLAICQTPQTEKVLLNQTFGTAVQHLRMDVLKNFPIPVPSLEEQQKAIEELNNIRKMIKNSEENTKTLKCSLSLSLSLMREKQPLKDWETLPLLNMDIPFLPAIEENLGSLGLQI
jgi:type I restriction-modification system DNA methylase subunit